MNVRGRANQIQWHPRIKGFFTGAHEDPRDAAGIEIPEDMSAAMIEAWDSEGDPDQAVLIKFAAFLHAVTTRCWMQTWTGRRSLLATVPLQEPRCAEGGQARARPTSVAVSDPVILAAPRPLPPFYPASQSPLSASMPSRTNVGRLASLGPRFLRIIQPARCVCAQNLR